MSFPDEITLSIFKYVPKKDVINNLFRVDKKWSEVAHDESLWGEQEFHEYKVRAQELDLKLQELVLNNYLNIELAEVLDELLTLEESERYSLYKELFNTIPYKEDASAVFSLYGLAIYFSGLMSLEDLASLKPYLIKTIYSRRGFLALAEGLFTAKDIKNLPDSFFNCLNTDEGFNFLRRRIIDLSDYSHFYAVVPVSIFNEYCILALQEKLISLEIIAKQYFYIKNLFNQNGLTLLREGYITTCDINYFEEEGLKIITSNDVTEAIRKGIITMEVIKKIYRTVKLEYLTSQNLLKAFEENLLRIEDLEYIKPSVLSHIVTDKGFQQLRNGLINIENLKQKATFFKQGGCSIIEELHNKLFNESYRS